MDALSLSGYGKLDSTLISYAWDRGDAYRWTNVYYGDAVWDGDDEDDGTAFGCGVFLTKGPVVGYPNKGCSGPSGAVRRLRS